MLEMSTKKITRINHVPDLCRRRGWNKKTALRELSYHGNIARPTAEKAYNGDTDLSMETVEKLAVLFGVTKDEVLETIYR